MFCILARVNFQSWPLLAYSEEDKVSAVLTIYTGNFSSHLALNQNVLYVII